METNQEKLAKLCETISTFFDKLMTIIRRFINKIYLWAYEWKIKIQLTNYFRTHSVADLEKSISEIPGVTLHYHKDKRIYKLPKGGTMTFSEDEFWIRPKGNA